MCHHSVKVTEDLVCNGAIGTTPERRAVSAGRGEIVAFYGLEQRKIRDERRRNDAERGTFGSEAMNGFPQVVPKKRVRE